MAKRFTDTDKWKKHFIKSLPPEYKLFWLFILDDCDNAGIWHVELEVAEARLGIKLSLEKIRGFFKERIVEFDGGTKMFVPDFVQFQYGSLNEKNNAHKSVIDKLNKYKLLDLMRASRGPKDMDMDKDMVKDMDKDKAFGKSENLLLIPEMFAIFKKNNPSYPGSIDRDYKPLLSIATFLCELGKLTGSPDLHRGIILEAWDPITKVISKDTFYKQKTLSTISNQIQEITQISLNGKATSKTGKQDYGSQERGSELNRLFTERYGSGGSTTG